MSFGSMENSKTSRAVQIAQARSSRVGSSQYAGRAHTLLERSALAFRNSAWLAVLSGFLEPVLYLVSFGYGLGHLIGHITLPGGRAVSYAMFIAPGLLATSAMNGAIYDSTWNVFFKLKHDRIYQGMLQTSLGPLDVALGEIMWALLRGFAYACGFMCVVVPMGLIKSAWGALAIPAAVLIAFGFASLGMGITSCFKSYQQMDFINIALLPLFLFSGSFYPLTVYPGYLQGIIKALPLWQAIDLERNLTLGIISRGDLIHLCYFIVMIAIGLTVTTKRLTKLFLR
jgi:lipooligosaccharide transport system permease protein